MTDTEARALGERWIARNGWARHTSPLPNAYWRQQGASFPLRYRDDRGVLWRSCKETLTWWPDFRDAATRGAALEVVRERWGAPYAQVTPWIRKQPTVTCSRWRVCINDADDHEFEGATEPEALVATLEAAT